MAWLLSPAANIQVYLIFGLGFEPFTHGRVWQLLSYALLHANASHLFTNVIMLVYSGRKIQHILGRRRCAEFILVGALAGGIFHLGESWLLHANGAPSTTLVGISGAVFALLCGYCTLSPTSRFFPLPVKAINLRNGIIIASSLLMLSHPQLAIPGISQLGKWFFQHTLQDVYMISHSCHLGGALAGTFLANWSQRIALPARLKTRQADR
ncbi:rhomboid family intramembrane serine protease [Persicirhabdus sediminis]|uniref:Rhomboid family intramembrane serine protease n=1 Tax=Persicirhabdus sediminis TaxID=454144 RepID=A0A8J7MGB6_9BACT|nr:rhomboid family intramembrane serine protease [Persicirhabdus sediminis]MBK1792380.1 rhomboid family intramembrane serine protease [Persicirhabdus sediminis]